LLALCAKTVSSYKIAGKTNISSGLLPVLVDKKIKNNAHINNYYKSNYEEIYRATKAKVFGTAIACGGVVYNFL